MRRNALILTTGFAFVAGMVMAQTAVWQDLDGAELRAALEGRSVVYDSGATQDFRVWGRTLYDAGQASWARWRVQDDQYCSLWPPQDLWACYDMQRRGNRLRFIGSAGDVTEAPYAD